MAVFITVIPDFRFSGLYYPQIYQSLIIYRRTYMKELTDEDPNEPTTQLQGSFSAGFHYCNVLLDHVGLESLFATCRLRPSAKNHLTLIAVRLLEALPASTDLLAKLGSPVTSDTTIPAGTLFGTVGTIDQEEILFERIEAYTVVRTDLPSHAFEEDGGVFTDVINEINGFGPLDLWGGVPVAEDALWIGHDSCLWNAIRLYLSDDGDLFDDENNWVLEYYDGRTDDSVPSDVELVGAELKYDLTNLLGTNDRSGTEVTVKLLVNGTEEVGTSYFSGGTNYVKVGLLGQSVPSEENADYVVGAKIKEVPDAVLIEHTDGFEIQFELPESTSRRWQRSTVNGVESFWLRLRAVNNDSTDSPVFDNGLDMTVETQWLKFEVTQGETYEDDPVGIFDGTASQSFETTQENVIDGSIRSFVDEGGGDLEYTLVDDFLSSAPSSLHFIREFDDDSRGKVTHGDGLKGYMPSIAATCRLQYRIGAEDDGNVGAEEITVAKAGPSFIASVYNPRPATGWVAPQGSTDASLAEVKITGPASLRIRQRAVTTDDMEELAEAHIFENGSDLVDRAVAIPNGFGDKTVKLIVVGKAGIHLSDAQLDELSLAFNGDPVAGIPGYLVAGLELTAVNYVRNVIDVTATVVDGDKIIIEAGVASYLSPTKQRTNGDWEHEFEGIVYTLDVLLAIKNADDDVAKIQSMADPAIDVVLGSNELPFPGVINITVVSS